MITYLHKVGKCIDLTLNSYVGGALSSNCLKISCVKHCLNKFAKARFRSSCKLTLIDWSSEMLRWLFLRYALTYEWCEPSWGMQSCIKIMLLWRPYSIEAPTSCSSEEATEGNKGVELSSTLWYWSAFCVFGCSIVFTKHTGCSSASIWVDHIVFQSIFKVILLADLNKHW